MVKRGSGEVGTKSILEVLLTDLVPLKQKTMGSVLCVRVVTRKTVYLRNTLYGRDWDG